MNCQSMSVPELPQGTDFFSDFVELRAFAVALTKLVVPIGIKKEGTMPTYNVGLPGLNLRTLHMGFNVIYAIPCNP